MTICSYDNSGQLKFDVDIEMAQGYWNTSSSRLWTRIRDLMHDDLVAKYNDMRQNGLSYESLMQCFYDEQIAKIPQKYYNMDYDVKYAPFSDSYLGMANGDTYEHLKRWLKNRLIFVDTLYDYAPSYNNDVLTIRANTTEPMTIYIETYTPVYQHLSWYNGQMDKKKIDGKIAVEFTGTAMAATDQEVLIYGGANVKKITGISSMNPNRMLIGSATRLIELDAHDCPLLSDINANKSNLAPHVYLNKVNLSGCPLLGGNLIINNSPLVREIDIRGTGIVGLNLPSNLRNLEVLKLPSAIKTLNLNDAGQLHTLEFDPGSKMETVSMTNCNALTNVVNFDLENVANVALNNSYNTANELYFSKAANLSLRNMPNLERVIYLPNAEYEVFDKTNVDNASDYKVSVFNSPKCNTFMVTAPYRESYNNVSGYVDKEIEVLGDAILTENYSPKGVSFIYNDIFTDFENGGYIEAEVDLSTCINNLENIISFGINIAEWSENKNIHTHYNTKMGCIGVHDSVINQSVDIPVTKIAIIRLDASGIYINGTKCFENSLIGLKRIDIGSQEGRVRSNAFYNYIKYYGYVSAITQIKDYGNVQPNTTFIANSIDISNTQFTDVKLLATTDTNVLKLPSTTKNIIVDSAYDLDTEYLTDGDYDTVHTDLYEPYNTDYEDVVNIFTEEKILKNLDASIDFTNYATELFEVFPGTKVYFTNNNITDANITQIRLYEYDKDKVEITSTVKWGHLTDETNAWVLGETTRYITIYMTRTGTFTLNYYGKVGYIPNIVPSASDGSLIFSMYAPSMTEQPDSYVWDMSGLDIETFHTFGLNNDIVQDSEGKVQMPNRYDDYVHEVDNLRFPNEVLRYTASAPNVFPTFRAEAEFQYDSVVTLKDGLYEHIIVAKDPNNLPTRIEFSDGKVRDYIVTVDYVDTSNCRNMESMFYYCSKLISVNLTDCNTSKVTNMSTMFQDCTSLEHIIGLDTLDTSNVTNMNSMFFNCNKLTSLDLSNFDTKNVMGMADMFNGCNNLTSLDLSNFDTTSVTGMNGMFNSCSSLTSLDLSSFDTSNVMDMTNMFTNCKKLTQLDLSSFNTKEVKDMNYMFQGCTSLEDIIGLNTLDTSNVTSMHSMFSNCQKLLSLDLSNFDTSKVTGISNMFNNCGSLTSLDLSSFDTSKVTNTNGMFNYCNSLCSLLSMQNISSSLNLSQTKLDADSILDIIANLVVVTDTKTLTLPTVELVEGAILIATNKGWEVVGDITIAEPDEGGDNEEGSITLSQDTLTFNIIGENRILTADITGSIIGEDITWQSNNENIAKVSGYTSTSGIVTSKGNGECTITAICGDYSATCSVIVNSTNTGDGGDNGNTGDGGDTGDGGNNIACTSIYITPEAYTFTSIAQEYELSVNVTPSNTTDEIFWSTSNGAIAQVVNGTVTSVGNGECIITATCGDYSATCSITVSDDTTNNAILTDFTLNADFNVTSKNYYRVECTPIPSSLIGVGTVWWSSSDPAVLGTSSTQGDSMTFIPGRSGTCTITVTYDAGSQGYLRKKYTATVTIPDETRNVEILYDNPTITIENLKAKAVQGTAVQYFDVSYEINDGHPSYNSSLELYDNERNKYYLALTNKGTSPFGKNNLHLDSAGWYTESSETSGVFYKMQASVIYWNNFNLNLTVRNKDNSVHDELLSKALFNFNQTLPALNMVVDNSSSNTIQLADLEDSWLGLCGKYADSMNFYITLNNTAMTKNYGPYSASNNRWLSTTVHELGHTLGTSDNCAHHPSMYTYTRDTSKCVYLQPNDIAWIEYLHKEMYGIDLITTQENINAQVSSLDLNAIEIKDEDEMHFEYGYTIPDVVVECELEYVETTHLNISKESEFYMEYDIYEIVNETVVGGDLTNKQLKLPVGQKINVDTSKRYRLSLIEYETAPCSLVNPDAMIIIGGK